MNTAEMVRSKDSTIEEGRGSRKCISNIPEITLFAWLFKQLAFPCHIISGSIDAMKPPLHSINALLTHLMLWKVVRPAPSLSGRASKAFY